MSTSLQPPYVELGLFLGVGVYALIGVLVYLIIDKSSLLKSRLEHIPDNLRFLKFLKKKNDV
jgi:hypothetical protein